MAFEKDDFFKIDCEPHLVGNLSYVNHFPGVQMWWKSAHGVLRALMWGLSPEKRPGEIEPGDMESNPDPAHMLAGMDKFGID